MSRLPLLAASLGAWLVVWPGSAAGQAAPPAVTTDDLPNGLRVLVVEVPGSAAATLQVWIRTGTKDDRPGTTGIASLAARLLVRGSGRKPGDDPARTLALVGGALRTASGPDLTGFVADIPADRLLVAVQQVSDRVTRPLEVDDGAVALERGRPDGRRAGPLGAAVDELWAAAFTAHPYGWPPLGWPSDLLAVTGGDCRQAALARFSPERSVVVVAGPTPAAEAKRLVRRFFLRWRRQPPPGPAPSSEGPQHGERRVVTRPPGGQEVAWLAGYHVPSQSHADTPAVEVLARVLAHGSNGRLWQRLVEEDAVATRVAVQLHRRERPSLLTIEAQGRTVDDARRLEELALQEVERTRAETCSERDLARARGVLELDHALLASQVTSLAQGLAEAELVAGGWRVALERPQGWQAVTPDDVRRVAQQYLSGDNRTVVTLLPEAGAGKTAGLGAPGKGAGR